MVCGKVPRLRDPIHDPLLDQYSQETGLPRETVTQHDPGYEAWLLGGSTKIAVDMQVPARNPTPDYSRDESALKAWERANLRFSTRAYGTCSHLTRNGAEWSFVTEVHFEMLRPEFEYFIAREISENMNDRTKPTEERIAWRQIHSRILVHAAQHFVRFRQIVESMKQTVLSRLSALPNQHHPVQLPEQVLQGYIDDLLAYLSAKLHYELWKTTCDWEKNDYPTLLKGIPNATRADYAHLGHTRISPGQTSCEKNAAVNRSPA